jgi:hypothetical protein
MSDAEFLRATNPEESARLYRSMSLHELQANCLAADKLLRERIEETESAVRFGRQAENLVFAQDEILRGTLQTLNLIAKLTSRPNRGKRQEEIERLTKTLSDFLRDGGELVPNPWPQHLECIDEVREVARK